MQCSCNKNLHDIYIYIIIYTYIYCIVTCILYSHGIYSSSLHSTRPSSRNLSGETQLVYLIGCKVWRYKIYNSCLFTPSCLHCIYPHSIHIPFSPRFGRSLARLRSKYLAVNKANARRFLREARKAAKIGHLKETRAKFSDSAFMNAADLQPVIDFLTS